MCCWNWKKCCASNAFLFLQGAYAVVEFSSRESIASLKESTNIPAVEHEAAVPFKSRLLSLKWPGSQSSNHPMPKFKEQSPPSINEISQLLSEKDTVSPLYMIGSFYLNRRMLWLMEKDKNWIGRCLAVPFYVCCLEFQICILSSTDRWTTAMSDRDRTAHRREHQSALPCLFSASRHSWSIFPRMHYQAFWLLC